jgi:predicted nucleotidyltransferase component of viral defense system
MRLFEHQDFETIMIATGEHFGMRPQFAEKDYYVTEALREVAAVYGEQVVFKGGTSLSKGWGLISDSRRT